MAATSKASARQLWPGCSHPRRRNRTIHRAQHRSGERRAAMTAEELADRLHARASGTGFVARCPAHADRSPSLSIREGSDGRVLLHCFAGCSVESVCDALKIRVSNLFSGSGRIQPKPRAVRDAEKAVAPFRNRLTPRERVLPITVVYCELESLEAAIARALALAVGGELVQAVLADSQ